MVVHAKLLDSTPINAPVQLVSTVLDAKSVFANQTHVYMVVSVYHMVIHFNVNARHNILDVVVNYYESQQQHQIHVFHNHV